MIIKSKLIESKDYRDGVRDALSQVALANKEDEIIETSELINKEIDLINKVYLETKKIYTASIANLMNKEPF